MNLTLKIASGALALLILIGCGGAFAKDSGNGLTPEQLASHVEILQQDGPAANRVNLLLLGDGYQLEDQAKLTQDAQAWLASFRSTSPLNNYASYFNVKLVHLVSAEDGAGNGSHGFGVARANALGATFQNANPAGETPDYRLLVVDNARAQALAMALAPECTQLLVLVNDANYGGSGGCVTVFSTNPQSCRIALHEFGHSFGGLADEYQCDETSALPGNLEVFPNVTAEQDPAQIKWRNWIKAGTALPTPAAWPYANDPGLFEGAYYHDTGVFRPQVSCRMRALSDGYCAICSEAIVHRIYDQIQPAESAGSASALILDAQTPLDLAISRPVPSPDTVQVTWTVDGTAVGAKGEHLSLPAGALGAGAHWISAQLADATPLVRTGTLGWVQTWTVNADMGALPMVVSESQQHQLLRVSWNGTGFEVVERRLVDLPLPHGASHGPSAWQVAALDADGMVQFQTDVENPTLVRGEFQHTDASERIQGHRLGGGQTASFLVRLPVQETRSLEFYERKGAGGQRTRLGTAGLEGVELR